MQKAPFGQVSLRRQAPRQFGNARTARSRFLFSGPRAGRDSQPRSINLSQTGLQWSRGVTARAVADGTGLETDPQLTILKHED